MTFIPSVNYEYAIFNEAPKLVLFNPIDLTSKLFYKTISNISNITNLGITNESSTIKNVSNISNAIVKPAMKEVSNDMLFSQFFLSILFFILLFYIKYSSLGQKIGDFPTRTLAKSSPNR